MDVTTNNTKSKVNIRLLVGTGMLSGLAFVLQYLEFPIPIMPGFIKFDFSDLPALIGAFAYGPLAGVIVEFIKNLLHCTVTQSFTVGELSNFILGAVFTATAGLIYKKNKSKKGAIIGAVVGSVVMESSASRRICLSCILHTQSSCQWKQSLVPTVSFSHQ